MATEIERKFLVLDERWRANADDGRLLRQGYLTEDGIASVRVRLAGHSAWLSIKSASAGISRREYEYVIPLQDAAELLDNLCVQPLIEKTRFHVHYDAHLWEIDVFHGANAGLVVAEIELDDEHEAFTRPPWLGEEVSHDPRYYNACLVKHPFRDWT